VVDGDAVNRVSGSALLLILLRRASPQVRGLNGSFANIEGCELTRSHNFLRGLSIAQ
jgi:hypothetical protein